MVVVSLFFSFFSTQNLRHFLDPVLFIDLHGFNPWTETAGAGVWYFRTLARDTCGDLSTMDRDTNERFSPWTETVVTVVQHFSSMDRDTVFRAYSVRRNTGTSDFH